MFPYPHLKATLTSWGSLLELFGASTDWVPHDFRDFRQHGPRMRVDDPDSPSGEFVARAPPYITSRVPYGALPANTCANDILAAFVFAVPVTPLPALTEGTYLDRRATLSPSLPHQPPTAMHLTLARQQSPSRPRSPLTKQRREPSLLLCLPPRLSRAPNGFRSSRAPCCV